MQQGRGVSKGKGWAGNPAHPPPNCRGTHAHPSWFIRLSYGGCVALKLGLDRRCRGSSVLIICESCLAVFWLWFIRCAYARTAGTIVPGMDAHATTSAAEAGPETNMASVSVQQSPSLAPPATTNAFEIRPGWRGGGGNPKMQMAPGHHPMPSASAPAKCQRYNPNYLIQPKIALH